MAFDNTNRGILSKNQNKTADNHPEYSGSINVDGTDYWLSAWIKESSKDGRSSLACRLSLKTVQKPSLKQSRKMTFLPMTYRSDLRRESKAAGDLWSVHPKFL